MWVLLLSIGLAEPEFTVTQGFTVKYAPVFTVKPMLESKNPALRSDAQAKTIKATSYAYPAGYHEHQCVCGNRWGHSEGVRGSWNDHRCARCGRFVWEVAQGLLLPPPTASQSIMGCPT